ncbi:MAG: hypothetical protein IPF66_18005 [Holophagales bacterium]|nr:hypothetical protein [Holophagales bacterium]
MREHLRLGVADDEQMEPSVDARAPERVEEERPSLLQLEVAEHSEDALSLAHVLGPPSRGPLEVVRDEGPLGRVDAVGDEADVGRRVERGDLPQVVARDGGDGGGAGEGVPQRPPAPEREEARVEVVAAQERHERDAEPCREGRSGEDGRGPSERDDVGRRVGKPADLVPEEVDRVRGVVVERGQEKDAPLLPLQPGPVFLAPEVCDVDGEARGTQRADDPVARLRHPATVGRVVLGEDERAQRQLSPNPAPPSSDSVSPVSLSSKERVS